MATRTVLILLFDGVQSLDVTGPLEVFAGASRHQEAAGQAEPAYAVRTASLRGAGQQGAGRHITTSSGLGLVPGDDLAAVRPEEVDTLVVPGGTGTARPDPGLVAWLARAAPLARRVASVCTGAFLLAEAGLLAGRRATTHWSYCDALARRYPDVRVDPAPIYVRDGSIATSAGVTAGIDLSLALVEEDIGRAAALAVARHLVVFLRRPGGQAQFSAQLRAQVAQRTPLRDVQQWISEHPEADLSVEALAARARLSPRQFARVFAAETGVTPGRHVAAVRLEAAQRLLQDPAAGIEQVAKTCGYTSPEAMRRAFVQALGVPPASYRGRF